MSRRGVAFVTGASRGIGRSIAIELARSSFDIVGNARAFDAANPEVGLVEVQGQVEALGAAFVAAPGDIARLEEHERLLATALRRFGRVDVLVSNAGIGGERGDVLDAIPEDFDRVLAVNTRGPFFLAQRFARQMIEQSHDATLAAPAIIFISSISSHTSSPSRAGYCLSKAALSHAATIYADRLAEHGINVYDVRPGIIATDMTAAVQDEYDVRIADGLVPQRRWGQPEDVGRAVAALARGEFGYSTGAVIEVSGGMNIRHL